MAIDHLALKSELQTDPDALGYAPHIASGDHISVAALINAVSASYPIEPTYVTRDDVIKAVDTTDLDWLLTNAPALAKRWDWLILAETFAVGDTDIRALVAETWADVAGQGQDTRAALIALQTRNGSRAEDLFGENVRVGHLDVAVALAS